MQATPYALVSAAADVRRGSKAELVGLTRRLEREALRRVPPAVAASLQDARFDTGCPDAERSFTYGLSHDPHVVAGCGRILGI